MDVQSVIIDVYTEGPWSQGNRRSQEEFAPLRLEPGAVFKNTGSDW